ncbi:hypothetical protein OF83DRAFT_1159438, partial [Amylostereum chailletii]
DPRVFQDRLRGPDGCGDAHFVDILQVFTARTDTNQPSIPNDIRCGFKQFCERHGGCYWLCYWLLTAGARRPTSPRFVWNHVLCSAHIYYKSPRHVSLRILTHP